MTVDPSARVSGSHPRPGAPALGGRAAWSVWGGGLAVQAVAVFQRFSLGVAGVEAAHRLGVGAAGIGVIAVAQLAVYAALQVPAGVLVDRFGFKRLLIAGSLLMAGGQGLLAFADSLPTALAARLLVGFGDGFMFICLARLIAAWFPPRRNPVLLQTTGLIGQLGAIASAVPVIYLLHTVGWTRTFLIAAGLGVAAALVGAVVLREPAHHPAVSPPTFADLRRALRQTWAEPGTRLGLWTHFSTQFPAIAFALLWGYPFLVVAQGLDPATAGVLLTILTVSFMCFGPVLGYLVGRYPLRRSWMALTVVAVTAATWTAVLLWPGPAPLWLLVTLVVVLGVDQPGSMIGFDFARSFNPVTRLGSATGIVNVGGFLASLISILLIGLVLGAFSAAVPGTGQGEAFRWAFAVQYPLWALGAVQILRYRRKARRAYGGRPATVLSPTAE